MTNDSNINTVKTFECIDPKIDVIFRALFTNEIECLKDLVNSVIHFPIDKEITEIEVLDSHLLPNSIDDKLAIMDIKAKSRDGYQFNIEMQVRNYPSYSERALFYWSRFYTEQLKKEEPYTKLIPTISINILNFKLFKDTNLYHHEFGILEKTRHIALTNHFEMHFLELPKVPKDHRLKLESWLLFLKNPNASYIDALIKENPMIEKANSKLKELSEDESLRLISEARLKANWDYISGMDYAKNEGRAEGKSEGKAEGKAEVILALVNSGLPKDKIAEFLKISLDELQKIIS